QADHSSRPAQVCASCQAQNDGDKWFRARTLLHGMVEGPAASPSCILLALLARDDCFRSGAACNGGRSKDRKIGVAARESLEADLAIPDGGKLATQEIRRGAVLGRRCEGVDDADARVRLERGDEVVEEGIRLGDLV